MEGSLRNRERELARLNEQLSLSKGVEVDVRSKGSKVEEGAWKPGNVWGTGRGRGMGSRPSL